MKNDDYCSGCGQKETCKSIYEKLGRFKGPNVALKAIVAFLVPIGVFVSVLVAGQRLLQAYFEGRVLILVSFGVAVCVTLLAVCVIRAFFGPAGKNTIKKG